MPILQLQGVHASSAISPPNWWAWKTICSIIFSSVITDFRHYHIRSIMEASLNCLSCWCLIVWQTYYLLLAWHSSPSASGNLGVPRPSNDFPNPTDGMSTTQQEMGSWEPRVGRTSRPQIGLSCPQNHSGFCWTALTKY